MAGQAMAQSNRVQVKDDWVQPSKESKTKTQHLSEDVVTLYGQEDRTEFTYQVDQEKTESSTLTFNIEASPLLISPSSFTVMIDGEIEKTIPVSGKKPEKVDSNQVEQSTIEKRYSPHSGHILWCFKRRRVYQPRDTC